MYTIKNTISFVLILLSINFFYGQQLPQFTQYMYNTISINPAYAGSRGTLSMVGLHRSQWVGLDGSPSTQTISIHAPLRNNKIGLGMSLINDELGFENFSYIYSDFSYTIQINDKSKLAFGLKAGFTHYSLDPEFQDDQAFDPTIFGIRNRWNFNIGTGAYWYSKRWYLGVSAPRLITTNLNRDEGFSALERVSYYFNGGYVFDLGNYTKFKPAFLVKATNGAPISFDLTANFLFYEKLWLGGGYRINERASSIGVISDYQISKQLRIGYAYEYPLSDLSAYTSGTHEILLIFEIVTNNRIKSPRYF